MTSGGEERVGRWERRTAAWLTMLALLFLVVYAVPILWPALPGRWQQTCEVASGVIWLLFLLDFGVRLWLHPARLRYVRTHMFDVAVLLLPMLRPLRLLRLLTAVMTISRRTERWARGRLALYVGATTALLVLVSALAVLDAERGDPNANIASFPQALWWSVVTITTVGYGDHFPTTATGQLVALALMIGGIGLIGFVTGSLASWIVERVGRRDDVADAATKADIATIRHELQALRRELIGLSTNPVRTGRVRGPRRDRLVSRASVAPRRRPAASPLGSRVRRHSGPADV